MAPLDINEILLRVRAEFKDADDGLSAIQRRLLELDAARANPKVELDTSGARRSLDSIKTRLEKLDHTDVTAKVKVDTRDAEAKVATFKLHGIRAMQALGLAAVAVGPQILASLGQGLAGAGALGVALGGAAAAFGVLGLAAKTQLDAAAKSSKAQSALIVADTKKVASAQAAVDQSYSTGTAKQQAAAQQRLALAQQQLDSARAQQAAQGTLADRVVAGAKGIKAAFISALGPGTQQLFRGILSLFSTVKGSLSGLTGPFLTLGRSIKDALSSPETQAGVRSLIDGFGKMVTAVAPLTGPIIQGIIKLGEILLNIARAAMPDLVGQAGKLVGWLSKIAASTSDQAKLKDQIHALVLEFDRWVKFAGDLIHAAAPLFTGSASEGIRTVLLVVVKLVAGFVDLLNQLGPVGRIIGAGLGLAFIVGRFQGLIGVLGLAAKGVKALAVAFGLLKTEEEGAAAASLLGGVGGKAKGLLSKIGSKLGLGAGVAAGAGAAEGAGAATAAAAGAEGGVLAGGAALAPETLGISLALAAAVAAAIHYRKQINEALKGSITDTKGSLGQFAPAVKGSVVGALGIVAGLVVGFRKPIGDAAKTVGNAIVSGVKSAAGATASVASSIAGSIVSHVRERVSAAGQAASIVGRAIASGLSSAASSVAGAASSIASRVVSIIKGAASGAASVGASIAQGLANGISSGAGAVASAASSIASSAINTAKGILGIHSPSTVFHAHGSNVSQGFANGILAGVGKVVAATKAMTNLRPIVDIPTGPDNIGKVATESRSSQSRWTQLLNYCKQIVADLEGIRRDLAAQVVGSLGSSVASSLDANLSAKGTLGTFVKVPRGGSPFPTTRPVVAAGFGYGKGGGSTTIVHPGAYQTIINTLHPMDPQTKQAIATANADAARRSVLPTPHRTTVAHGR